MNLLVIDCKKRTNGFRHRVVKTYNGGMKPQTICAFKSEEIIEPEFVESLRKDPVAFLESIKEPEAA